MTTNWLSIDTAGTLTGTSVDDQLSTSNSGATLVGLGGDDIYVVGHRSTMVVEQADGGNDTIRSYDGEGYKLPNHVENLLAMQASNSWLLGNDLDNSLVGGSGNNHINGGNGNDVLTGGDGRDTFVIYKGEGSDTITDFTPGVDIISLHGFANYALIQVGANVVVQLDGGAQHLTLLNINVLDLSSRDFQNAIDKSSMVPTFFDDFNVFDRFDGTSGTWTTQYIWSGDGSYYFSENGEKQVYVDTNFKGLSGTNSSTSLGLDPFEVIDGQLIITATPVTDSARPFVGNQTHTSGVITTADSFAQTYGYFEISASLDNVAGFWPAFWLLPANGSWPPEIDIFESLGGRGDQISQGAVGTGANSAMWSSAPDLYDGTHTMGMKWTPYEITFYVDGNSTLTIPTPDSFSSPMYMIANLAVGGYWSGDPDANASATFTINSINVYQLPEYTTQGFTLKVSGEPTASATGNVGSHANELFEGLSGALAGGEGDDTYVISSPGQQVIENLGGGVDTVRSSFSFFLSANLENLTLTGSEDINGTGNEAPNILIGNDGNNVLDGGAGNDILTGGGGNDVFVIGRDNGTDFITDFTHGEDRIQFLDLQFVTWSDVQAAIWQSGNDVIIELGTYDQLVIRDTRIADFSAVDFIFPERPTESLMPLRWVTGTSAADTLHGSNAADWLQGYGGNDTLIGGKGDDTYDAYLGITIIESVNGGIDTVRAWGNYTLPDNVENLLLATAGVGSGNGLSNLMMGSSGNDTLRGLGGNDWLEGNAGDDTLIGGAGNDRIIGGAGFDTCVLEARWEDCLITYDGTGILTISSEIDGTDRVSEVEAFRFADRTLTLAEVLAGLSITSSISYDLSLSPWVANLTLTGKHAIDGVGNSLDNVITGNGASNVLDGGAGNDILIGGLGNDTYLLGDGNDVVIELAGGGTDTIVSSVSRDLNNYAEVENLTLVGSANINATGNVWANVLIGNDGDNILDGGPGADILMGGLGNDTYVLAGATNDTIIDIGGIDTITSTITRDLRLYQGIENLTLTFSAHVDGIGDEFDNVIRGNAGRNTLMGLGGDDILYGGDGNDILDGGDGNDTLYGGRGNDTYVLGDGYDTVIDEQGWDTITSTISRDLNDYPNIENLTLLGSANINATGNVWSNTLIGNDGDNILDGGPGADILIGGLGNDTYVLAGATNDTIYDIGGIDTITSTITRDLRNYAGIENLTLTFSAHVDGHGDQFANVITGNAGNNSLWGYEGDDVLLGGAGHDILYGGAGNDILDGGTGNDTLYGGSGNDTYILGDGNDTVIDESGWDTIVSSISRDLNDYADIENLTLVGSGNINATGNKWSNTLIGNDGDNVLDGGPGADILIGGLGNDTYVLGAATNDTIIDVGGNDTITSTISRDLKDFSGIENITLTFSAHVNATGDAEDNRLLGNAGNNVLKGLGGDDVLHGGAGHDTLVGGLGSDRLNGGSGRDTFKFETLLDSHVGSRRDVIEDFVSGEDKIDLTLISPEAQFLEGNGTSFTGSAGQLRWLQLEASESEPALTLVELDADGDGQADFQIELSGTHYLVRSDFLL